MFCGETAGTSPTPKKYPDGEYVANEWKTIIVIIVLLVVLFLFWLFNNRLTRLRTTIRRGTARVVLYVWREARGLWTRTRRRFSGGRVEPSQDWRVRYNEGAGRDPASFFRDLVDLNVRMNPRRIPPHQSPQGHFIARRPHRPRPRSEPPPPPPGLPPSPPTAPAQHPPAPIPSPAKMSIPPLIPPLSPIAPPLPPPPQPLLPPPAPPMPSLMRMPQQRARVMPEVSFLPPPPPLTPGAVGVPTTSRVQPSRASKTTTPGYYRHTESWTHKVIPKKK